MLRSALDPDGAGGSAQSADEVAIQAASVLVTGPVTATGAITTQGGANGGGGGGQANAGGAGPNNETRKQAIDSAEAGP